MDLYKAMNTNHPLSRRQLKHLAPGAPMLSSDMNWRSTESNEIFAPGAPLQLGPAEAEAMAFLLPLSEDYPGIDRWFLTKVVPGLRVGTRTILRVERDGHLVGLGIAKDEDEKKICTVRVSPEYFGRGMGVRIFDGLLRWLDDDKPHLTVSAAKLPAFERIFESYKFRLTSRHPGLYVPMSCEMGFNESVGGQETF